MNNSKGISWVGLCLGFVLASAGYFSATAETATEGSVDLVVESEALPVSEDLKKTLEAKGIAGIALVDESGKLRAYTRDGQPMDLCEQNKLSGPQCAWNAGTKELIQTLSVTCGNCTGSGGGNFKCYKSGTLKNKYVCPNGGTTPCLNTCI